MSQSTSTTSKRKPFTVGTRVLRKVDGARGTVESVELYGVEGQPMWAVAVKLDSDGQTWSGTQETAARGGWRKLTDAELHELDDHHAIVANAAIDAAADAAADAALAAIDAKELTRTVRNARKGRRSETVATLTGAAAIVESYAMTPELAELAAAGLDVATFRGFEALAERFRPFAPTREEKRDAALLAAPIDATATAIASLTDAGREFMTAVGAERFDFFDEGIVAGSGNWGEGMSWQFAELSGRKKTSVPGIMAKLSKSGLWDVSESGDERGNWWELTELGASVAQKLAANLQKMRAPEPAARVTSCAFPECIHHRIGAAL